MNNMTSYVFLCGLCSQFKTLCRRCRISLVCSHFHLVDRFCVFTVAKKLGLGLGSWVMRHKYLDPTEDWLKLIFNGSWALINISLQYGPFSSTVNFFLLTLRSVGGFSYMHYKMNSELIPICICHWPVFK